MKCSWVGVGGWGLSRIWAGREFDCLTFMKKCKLERSGKSALPPPLFFISELKYLNSLDNKIREQMIDGCLKAMLLFSTINILGLH